MRRQWTGCLILISVIHFTCGGKRVNYIQKLHRDLFENYTKSAMPVYDFSQPLTVDVRFEFGSIVSFKEVQEMISVYGSLTLNWTDVSLSWDPASYGHIYFTILDVDKIWTPLMVLSNSVAKMAPVGGDTNFKVFLVYNGQILYGPGDLFEAKCPADVSKFPFDEQTCLFSFIAYGTPANVLTLVTSQKEASLTYFTPHSDWRLQSYSTEIRNFGIEQVQLFVLELKIKRSSLYYGIFIIAPTIMFSLLNPLVFLLPVDSGERVGLSMTILLSYAIFLTIVSTSTPASSNPMCALLVLMVIIIIISGIIVFGVIISVMYYNKTDVNEIGSCIKCLAIWNRKRNNDYDLDNETKLTGKDISDMLDSVFLYGSYLIIVFIVAGFVIYLNV